MKSTGNHSVRVEGAVQSGQGGYGQGYSGNATVKEAAETLQLEHNSLRIQLHLKHSQLPSYAFLDSMIVFNALYRPYLPLSRPKPLDFATSTSTSNSLLPSFRSTFHSPLLPSSRLLRFLFHLHPSFQVNCCLQTPPGTLQSRRESWEIVD